MPIIEMAIEGKSPADAARLLAALPARVARHPGCVFVHDRQSGQTILGGGSEPCLDALVDDLRACCAFRLGAPQVAYRETILRRVETDHTLRKRTTTSGLFARVKLVMEPGEGPPFTSMVVGGAVPDAFVAAVEAGVTEALAAGVDQGARVMGVAVTLIDGAWHAQDSCAEAFSIAGRDACREGLSMAGPAILEPVMRVEVTARFDHEGALLGDLRSRRGRIGSCHTRDERVVVEAEVPLANLFGYASDLRSLTGATGTYLSAFHAFELVPTPEPPRFPGAMALRG